MLDDDIRDLIDNQDLLQAELLAHRLLHWLKADEKKIADLVQLGQAIDARSILSFYVQHSIELRKWIDRFLQLAGSDANVLSEDSIYNLSQDYIRNTETIVSKVDSVDAIPPQTQDAIKIETATFLVRFGSDGNPLDLPSYGRQLIELSGRLDDCHRVLERMLHLVPSGYESSDEISRADLLLTYDTTTQGLRYRIIKMGHPGPIRVEGRKQWFSRAAVEAFWKANPARRRDS